MFQRKRINLAVLLALGTALSGAAIAQETLQRVEVTGSSLKRLDSETALPVTVMTRAEIARSGVTSTEALLTTITAISSLGGTLGSTGAGSSTYGLSAVSMRGLGSERTLVLVNGRRLAAFASGGGAAVNVNAIPLAAIERVEVLKDGASGVYGSDAVAGVINFILNKSMTGIDVQATYATPTADGGGQSTKASIVGGIGDLNKDRFNLTVSAGFEKDEELFAKDRSYSKTGNQFPYIVAGATGQGNIEGGYKEGTTVNGKWVEGTRLPGFGGSPGAGYGNPLAAQDKCADISMFKNPTNTSKKLPYCTFDSPGFVGLIPKRDATNFSGNFVFKITDKHEFFADALYSESVVTQQFQPSPVRRSFLAGADALFPLQGVDPALLIRPSNPNYKIAADYLTANGHGALVGQTLAVTARVFDFGLRTSEDTAVQTRYMGGLRGELFGLDYEMAYTKNESKTDGTVPNGYFSQVGFAKAVNAADSDYNPWSLTQSDKFKKSIESAKYAGDTNHAKSTNDIFDAKISGEAFQLPAGPLAYALGAQYRTERYVTAPSPALETGDIAGLGGATAPIDKERKVGSVFAEFSAPLMKSLEAGLAIRYDDYTTVGSTTNYKANLRYQPVKQVLVRASVGTGFRAPTLTDLYTVQTQGTSEQFNDPGTGETNLQVPVISGGNPKLKPETSKQASFGLVFSPVADLTMSADYFQVELTDIITTASVQEIVSGFRNGDASYAGLVKLSPSGSIDSVDVITTNTGNAKIKGVDVEANYRLKFDGSSLDLGMAGTYYDQFDQVSPGGVTSHKVGTMVDADGNPVLGANTGGVVLRWKHVLSATYKAGPWSGTLQQEYARGYEAGFRAIDGERNFMPETYSFNASGTYTGFKGLRLTLGARNLFDAKPKNVYTPVSNQFQAGYDINQYDPRGRYVYVTAGYKY